MGTKLSASMLQELESAVYTELESPDLAKGERNRLLALVKACSGVRADRVRSESQAKLDALRKP